MNWYKLAQNRSFSWANVDGILYTPEAMRDLKDFKKSQEGRSAKEISTLIKDVIDRRQINLRNVESRPAANPYIPNGPKEKIKIHVFEPRGVGLAEGPGKAYRIGAQLCSLGGETSESSDKYIREQEFERTGRKFLIIKRVFENHDEDYLPWISLYNSSHVDDCPKYTFQIQRKENQEKIVDLNPQNPFDWLVNSVKMIRDRNIEGISIHKRMLEGKSEEEIFSILEFMTKNQARFPSNILKDIGRWIEEYVDRTG